MVKNINYLWLALTAVLCTVLLAFRAPLTANAVKIIVIDPGHGGKDPGCSGSIHREKDVALAVALKLGKFIEENLQDVKVIYTRTTDIFVELEDRALIANKAKADLFISIHCNAAGKPVYVTDAKTGKKRPKTYKNKKGKIVVVETTNPIPFGTETYVMGMKNEEGKMKVAQRENSAIFYEEDYEKKYGGFDPESEESYIIMSNYTSSYVIQSANLAIKIQEEYTHKAGRIDKGVHRQSIWVLWRTSMPSILSEIGYLTNPLEEEFLGSAKGQDYLAKALFRGLRRYKDEVEGRKKEYKDEFENQTPLENENIKAGNLPLVKKPVDEEPEDLAAAKDERKEQGDSTPVIKN
ncbi:MAG: N-acetylmuramoyl-L-alanine amidase, partial [Sphingobacteriia bacterium]|nr:N-acetylmuramoyl-L-alanine amidase [Sphingobacteriia bacterium]